MNTSRKRQLIGGLAVTGALLAGGVAISQYTNDETPATDAAVVTDESTEPTVLSAADGAAARARLASFRSGGSIAEAAAPEASSSIAAEISVASDDFGLIECGEPWVPTAEDVAASNADTDGLAAAFDDAGVSYTVATDNNGFRNLEYDYADSAAEDVALAYWNKRYPPEPIDPESLAQNKAENDVLVAALEDAGVVVTRSVDDQGWESLDYDYESPAAQTAVDAAYAELYPPQPPAVEDLDWMRTENDRMAAALDAAGVEYVRQSDALGWEWIEWDFDDEAVMAKAMAALETLYPTEMLVDPIEEIAVDEIAIDSEIAIEPGFDCGDLVDENDPAVSFVAD